MMFWMIAVAVVAVALVSWCYSIHKVSRAVYEFLAGDSRFVPSREIDDIVLLGRLFPVRSPQIATVVAKMKHPFMKETFLLLLEGLVDDKTLERVLEARIKFRYESQLSHVERLRALARLPVVAALGAAIWFAGSGSHAEAAPYVVVAMATSYFLILPLADWLAEKVEEERAAWSMIARGARSILARTNPVVLSEEMNSFIDPSRRVKWNSSVLTSSQRAS